MAWRGRHGSVGRGTARLGLAWQDFISKEVKSMPAYQWRTPGYFKLDAQIAGDELERISNSKPLTPENIVDESRSETAVLHNCFDWNDKTAAESYRQVQAREIVRNIVTVSVDGAEVAESVRAFVSIQGDYKPISVVVKTKDYQDEMLQKALRELQSFQRKYSGLSQLAEVFESINRIMKAS